MNIKRIAAFIILSALLISCTNVLAENNHYSIGIQVRAGEQTFPVEADVFRDESMIYTLCSLFPDQCFQDYLDASVLELADDMMILVQTVADEKKWDTAKECVDEWLSYMQPETETGSYTGDAFIHASRMERVVFSYGDMLMLYQRLLSRCNQGSDNPSQKLGSSIQDLPEKNYMFELKLFDERKYISLNVLDRQNTIMTLSADISQPGQINAVLGCGFTEKNYYWKIGIEQVYGQQTAITVQSYADDYKQGFLSVDENCLIMTYHFSAELSSDQDTILFHLIMAPGKESMTPVEVNGTFCMEKNGRLLEGDAGFAGKDDLNIHFSVDRDEAIPDLGQRNILDLSNADSETIENLILNATEELTLPILQILPVIPEEYLRLLINP